MNHPPTPAQIKLRSLWESVYHWAKRRSKKVPRLEIRFDCELMKKTRAESPRAYMHTMHLGVGKVCISSDAADLPRPNIVGLFLHEIGHPLAQALYGRSEQEDADRAVKEVLGVSIKYKGALLLEWVAPPTVKWILFG